MTGTATLVYTDVLHEYIKHCCSLCKANYASILRSMIDEPFRPVCWSHPNILLDEGKNEYVCWCKNMCPDEQNHDNLPPWVTPCISHSIKKLATKLKFLPEGSGKLLQLDAQVDNALQLDRSDYEEHLL